MKEQLRQVIRDALHACFASGALSSSTIPDIQIEVPANQDHGDFATNVAMMMARSEKKSPRQVADCLVTALGDNPLWSRLEIAGPGFINFTLSPLSWYRELEKIEREGPHYGKSNAGQGCRIQIEFVSANPTGPLHIGHGRGAAVGDAVARLLAATGYDVQREYYINDAGNQVALLGRSIWARWQELRGAVVEFPEDGYRGEYIREIANKFMIEKGHVAESLAEEDAVKICGQFGMHYVLDWIADDLRAFGVSFDNWYSEQSLYDRKMVDKELAKLAELKLTYEKDGALWFKTTSYGDDKDRVLLRSDGAPTYFASDVAYHMEKFERGFNRLINVWGADHHGYVARMKAVLAGLGHASEDLEVLLIQMVNLLRDGMPVTMGKRSGEFVTLREVVDEVGRDASRFFFLMRRSDSQLDFDLELAKQQGNENPVYYVQYAHARICSINRNAAEQAIVPPNAQNVDLSLLEKVEELALAKLLTRYPETLVSAAQAYEPHRIIYFLQDLAAQFHSYYNRYKVLTDDPAQSRARLYLVNCVRTVLANALELLGVAAPERM